MVCERGIALYDDRFDTRFDRAFVCGTFRRTDCTLSLQSCGRYWNVLVGIGFDGGRECRNNGVAASHCLVAGTAFGGLWGFVDGL